MDHPHFGQIVAIAEGRSAPDADAERHLRECATCAADLAWLRRTLSLLRDAASADAPAAAIDQVKAIFRQRSAGARSGMIQALLRFDSARSAPAFGLRADAPFERQLLLSAGDYDLDLRIAPAGEHWVLAGQILGYAGPPGDVTLLGAAGLAQTVLNPLYEFTLPPIRPGRYNLTFSLSGQAIIVPKLEIGV